MKHEPQKWRPDRRVAWRAIDGRMVLVGGNEGKLYVLNGTGAELWERMCAGTSLEAMVSALEQSFTVTPVVARADVLRFIDQMQARGLVEPCDES